MSVYSEISGCRICNSKRLTNILDLGSQALTGAFPRPGEKIPESPVVVCKCNHCHLVQLRYTVELGLMYGDSYGYQSSLNPSMIRHLKRISHKVRSLIELAEGDVILDIGSNDGTFLKFFDASKYILAGIDPIAGKFAGSYGPQPNGGRILSAASFFSKSVYDGLDINRKAALVTSIACFYDLERPIEFARETAEILAPHGIWLMEMAYLPSILRNLCFDGYVQEHLEYYSLKDIEYIMDQVGLKIIDVELTDTNGGSFMVTVTHESNANFEEYWRLDSLLLEESHVSRLETHLAFKEDVEKFREKFNSLLQGIKRQGKSVFGLGASTKFNVVLQYCGVNGEHLPCIGEVNSYKFGRVTPGSCIPIVPEEEILKKAPDYLIIGPYHFRDSFVQRLGPYIRDGGNVIFPLPKLEVVNSDTLIS